MKSGHPELITKYLCSPGANPFEVFNGCFEDVHGLVAGAMDG
jgi:hypothetical protein